jgi:hypothetical protein
MIWAIGAILLFCMFCVNQIKRTWDFRQRFTAHMQIDHRGGQFRVAHEHLDSTQIMTGFQQVGGKAVPVMPNSAYAPLYRVPNYAE